MINILPVKRRRRPRIENSIVSPIDPLIVERASVMGFDGATAQVEIAFETTEADPLVNVTAGDPAKWTARIEGVAFVGSGPLEQLAFNAIRVSFVAAGASAGANVVSYTANPSDIMTASGRRLAAFVDRVLE